MNVVGLLTPDPIGNRPLLFYSLGSLLLGAQAMSAGMLAELLVANTGRESDTYSVAERTPLPDEDRVTSSYPG